MFFLILFYCGISQSSDLNGLYASLRYKLMYICKIQLFMDTLNQTYIKNSQNNNCDSLEFQMPSSWRLIEDFLPKHKENSLLVPTSLLIIWNLICLLDLSSPLCIILTNSFIYQQLISAHCVPYTHLDIRILQ